MSGARWSALFALFAQLALGEWRAHPVRNMVAVIAIALGVALGFAVHLVNASALSEFAAAVRTATGEADVELRGLGLAAKQGFDEAWLERLARSNLVERASPVIELDAPVAQARADDERNPPLLRVFGLDPLRAAHVNPGLVGRAAEDVALEPLDARAIYLSPGALNWLRAKPGDTVRLRAGVREVDFIVAGTVPGAGANQRVAVIDIAAAQAAFDRLGRVSRIDIKLAEGVSPARFKAEFALPATLAVVEPSANEARASNLSRAYRVNLNMLALVALFTGAFLVFSMQTLSVVRRRAQFALVRIVGASRASLVWTVVAEGALLGGAGAMLGLAGGAGLAKLVLDALGGDLGGGYFAGSSPPFVWSWPAAAVYAVLGLMAAVAGSALAAREAARAAPARAIKGGGDETALIRWRGAGPGVGLIALAGGLAALPPLGGIAVFGYLAILCLLVGGLWLMPSLATRLAAFGGLGLANSRAAVPVLAVARIANTPTHAGVVLAGVLASFSLMVAMAIMVASFRHSVDDWLGTVLPADLYVRIGAGGEGIALPDDTQRAIAALPGLARVEFARITQLGLDPTRPNVALIARALDDPTRQLPLTGDPLRVEGPAIHVSEAMVDLYGWTPGTRVKLALGERVLEATVASVWRDYARQFGAIALDRATYAAASGDTRVSDAWLWLAPGTRSADAVEALRALPLGDRLEIAAADEIRAISLRIFDRSFAVTYLLEAVAMVIGLAGIAAAFGAQALARAKEFGMLRHLGVSKRQVLGLLTLEGVLLTGAGVIAGLGIGALVSLVLIHVVNPQSFHWTMDVYVPWAMLAGVALALLIAAACTALVAGRAAVAKSAVLAVREDW
ncbi:MAG TPA: ABC transporter permease [Burkholderiaceae bacterium]|nr:ABC transporter permease [Burkholderiaceae bacterium]